MNWGVVARHLSNLGFVPPGFLDSQRIQEDPDELGYTLDLSGVPNVKTLSAAQLRKACDAIVSRDVQKEISQAAALAHVGDDPSADRHRQLGGYGKC